MAKNNKAVILARVSSKSQEDEGYSLDSQVKLLNNYCDSKGLVIMKVFKITESASKSSQRKTFKAALAYIETNNVKNLIIEKVDRHVRNLHDAVETHDWLVSDEHKSVHFIKDSLILHKNSRSQEWLNWGIRVVMAKNYIDNLREEAMKGWAEKLAQGWLPAPPPPGYKTVVENGKRIHVPDPNISRKMQRVFKLYLEPNQNIKTITQEMKRLGITNRSGNPYSKTRVHEIIQNPFYIGINRFQGVDHPGAQQPILPKKLFEAVQQKRTRKRPTTMKKHDPLLKGMIACSRCKGTVTWQKQKGRLYGSCQRKQKECKSQSFIKELEVNRTIIDMLDGLISPSQRVVEWLTELLRDDFKQDVERHKVAERAIQQRITRLKNMDDMLYDDKLSGEIGVERYIEKHEAFQAEIAELSKKLGGLSEEYKQKYEKGIDMIELSQVAKTIYLDENITNMEKRGILTKLFQSIEVKDGFLSVKYTKLTQAIANKSSESRRIYAKLKKA